MTLARLHNRSKDAPRIVSAIQIRAILAGEGHPTLSKESLSTFVSEGMPQASRGRYDRDACTSWYVGRLRTIVKRKATESSDGAIKTLDDAQRRLTEAKAVAEEMTIAERKRELISIREYEATLTSIVQVTKQRILNLPVRLAAKLEGLTTVEIKALLNAALRDALAEVGRAYVATKTPAPKPKKT